MKTVPTTYSEWTKLLDQFGNGDDSILQELDQGNFIIDAGTASRFYLKVENAYKKRKQSWFDKFQRSFHLENFKTDDDIEIALRNAKQNLTPLYQFIMVKGFPDNLKKTLRKDLEDFITEIRTSLKDNNNKVSKGKEKFLLLLNTFTFNSSIEESKLIINNKSEIIAPTGRKIIF